ncbi:hypothetical protein PI124_g17037 [Phytophthora idaei]|nr:hypothetical protein PI126_g16166 [Phytophthora idaei]KAG3237985.1 hypothetical protein PI124_g17037 [Phytophthora idaei]
MTGSALDTGATASQIGTSTALSQNIIAQLFGSESDSDTSSSHQHVIGAFQLLLSGAKSNRDLDGASSGGHSEGGAISIDDPISVPAADVNLLASEVFLNAYETVDSSGSKDSGSAVEGVIKSR